MQNSTFLVLLRPSFAPKMKTVPPTGMGSRSCEELPVIWTRKVEFFFLERTQSWSGEVTEFWLRLFFMRSPKFGWKNRFNFGEDLFFGDHLSLTKKPPQFGSRLMKIWVKFVYCCFHLSKKTLPLCEILATRLACLMY